MSGNQEFARDEVPATLARLTANHPTIPAEYGGGSASARSMRLGGWVMAKAADETVGKHRFSQEIYCQLHMPQE